MERVIISDSQYRASSKKKTNMIESTSSKHVTVAWMGCCFVITATKKTLHPFSYYFKKGAFPIFFDATLSCNCTRLVIIMKKSRLWCTAHLSLGARMQKGLYTLRKSWIAMGVCRSPVERLQTRPLSERANQWLVIRVAFYKSLSDKAGAEVAKEILKCQVARWNAFAHDTLQLCIRELKRRHKHTTSVMWWFNMIRSQRGLSQITPFIIRREMGELTAQYIINSFKKFISGIFYDTMVTAWDKLSPPVIAQKNP